MNSLLSVVTGSSDYSGDRLGRVKIVIVGNQVQGCGKTSLAHLLSCGQPAGPTTPTVGCNVTLMVMPYPADRAKCNPSLAGQEFFLELWDVGAHPRYETMRELFYQGVNGVILVHDLSFRRSLASLQRWAAEVCRLGTFTAPYNEDRASMNLGGLPVPCLVVGNKLDLVPKHRARYSISWSEQVWAALQSPLERLRDWAAGSGGGGGAGSGSSSTISRTDSGASSSSASSGSGCGGLGWGGLPKEALLHGNLQASVARGDLDMHAVTSFFCDLIERRYCPSSAELVQMGSGAASRMSSDRLPPVMYNAISEESSPYASMAGSLMHTPFASCASLAVAAASAAAQLQQQGRPPYGSSAAALLSSGSAGASWLASYMERQQQAQHAQQAQQAQQEAQQAVGFGAGAGYSQQPLQFPGCNVAVKLEGGASAAGQAPGRYGNGKTLSGPFADAAGLPWQCRVGA